MIIKLKQFNTIYIIATLMLLTACAGTIDNTDNAGIVENYSAREDALLLKYIPDNLSGITYNFDTNSYFLIRNRAAEIYEYNADFSTMLRKIAINSLDTSGGNDTEGIVYLGNSEFAVINESNWAIVLLIPDDGAQTVNASNENAMKLPPVSVRNNGLEGICYNPEGNNGGGTFYAVQERLPMKVFEFNRITDGNSIAVSELFDPEVTFSGVATDLSGCVFNITRKTLVIISDQSSKLIEVDLEGNILSTLDLPGSVDGGADQYEGVTFSKNKEIVTVSEANFVQFFQLSMGQSKKH